jgi:hypothetical protein
MNDPDIHIAALRAKIERAQRRGDIFRRCAFFGFCLAFCCLFWFAAGKAMAWLI